MSIEVKKQHYVWQNYLKGWATGDQIWCKRGGKIFPSSTENVAQERYFYEVDPLSDAEIKLLTKMVMTGPEINQQMSRISLDTYLTISSSGDKWRKFGIEQYHGMVEKNAVSVIENLRKNNLDIFNDMQSRIHLCIYLGHQYTRTKKARSSLNNLQNLSVPEEYKSCDLQKVQNAMIFVLANSIGQSLYKNSNLKLMENHSDVKFITSDQPIYNLLAIPGEIPDKFSIYFPISPDLALLENIGSSNGRIEAKDKVEGLNNFMVKNSLEFIFASTNEELLGLVT